MAESFSRDFSRYILLIDSFITFVAGIIMFLAPDKVGDFVFSQQKTDGVHWHLIRCVGGQLLSTAFVFFRFSTRGLETRTSCYVLRLTSSILAIFFFYHARYVHPALIQSIISNIVIYASYIAIIIYVVLLFTNGWKIGTNLQNSLANNILYQLDSIASVTIGLAWIAHPSWLLHRQVKVEMNQSHEFCGRLMGMMFLASQIISVHALHWKHENDKSLAAEARALCCVFILFAQVWSQVAYGAHWSGAHWVGISLFSTWTVIAIIFRVCIYFTKSTGNVNRLSKKIN